MSKTQRTDSSGRLSKRQLQFIRKITALGKKHPDKRNFYVFLLVAILLWFYLLAFLKKNAAILTAFLCSCLLIALLSSVYAANKGIEASDSDRQALAQQQELLKGLQDEIAPAASEKQENAFIRALQEENPDTVAWLTIPGTEIDYPVMQTPDDEDYYLYRDFYGNENQNGSLLLSAACDVKDENTNWIIHGHNMKSGEMFGSLLNYRKKGYLKDHNLIFLDTLEGRRTFEVIAVFDSQVYYESDYVFKYYQCYQIESWAEFDSFYTNIQKLSLYNTGVEAVYGDHFLTLSTCAYHTENGRFVVVAKELY